ncbi:hypothetical protein HUJ04_011269 [Dendroctonus ponderosae]|nr:hypothetical protein HUJ04_011269 [Dendroctonus ponderosae]
MKYKLRSFQDRLAIANKIDGTQIFQYLVRNEKILALSLFKNSPKGDKLLSKIFALPSTRTLRVLLQNIPFRAGINKAIFDSLEKAVAKMKTRQERMCILLFDEMAIQANLAYKRYNDKIIGLEDYGDEKRAVLSDHANVFMLRGIYRQWKQPIAFTFSKGPVRPINLKKMITNLIEHCQSIGLIVIATVCDQGSTNQTAIKILLDETKAHFLRNNLQRPVRPINLKKMITNLIEHCQSIGLIVIATVCDQGSTNQTAIKILLDETKAHFLRNNLQRKYDGFFINKQEIVPLFDVPHLFKGIRNNLLNKQLMFQIDGKSKIAKWEHLEQFYQLDASIPSLRICSKLTDAHIVPSKINKMRVKNCTQVFSHSVGSLMKRIAQWDKNSLSPDAVDAADLILFLDQLFDSLNVLKSNKSQAKPLKHRVTIHSEHEVFWHNSLTILKKEGNGSNFEKLKVYTKRRFTSKLLVKLLVEENFRFILTGAFNQDPLENFFSYVRSHGLRNTNPDASHFISPFKTLVVNNYISSHSPNSNCEMDIKTECLDNLRTFLTNPKLYLIRVTDIKILLECRRYQKMLLLGRKQSCDICKSNLSIRRGAVLEDNFIDVRQYDQGRLFRPGNYLNFVITHSLNFLFYVTTTVMHYQNISQFLVNFLKN